MVASNSENRNPISEPMVMPKQPKSLMNKFSHLMKDTKSSALRNAFNSSGKLIAGGTDETN